MDLLKIGLLSDKLDAYTLRDTADWFIGPGCWRSRAWPRDRVRRRKRQIQIQPELQKLTAYGVTIADLESAASAISCCGAASSTCPISAFCFAHQLRSRMCRPSCSARHQRNGTPVRLGTWRRLSKHPLSLGRFAHHGQARRHDVARCQYGANTLHHARAGEGADGFGAALSSRGIVMYPALHRAANFIERSLGDLRTSLLIASVLILACSTFFCATFARPSSPSWRYLCRSSPRSPCCTSWGRRSTP